jgi:hypothetical protein
MKFLNTGETDALNAHYLSDVDAGDRIINARIEAYSCKFVRAEGTLKKDLSEQYGASPQSCPLGSLTEPATRTLLFQLISTLNWSFPDYDFSQVSPRDFDRIESPNAFAAAINTQLLTPVESVHPGFREKFWNALEQESLGLSVSEIISFTPPDTCDLFDGCLYKFNYFLVNKSKKRIVFITGSSYNKLHGAQDEEEEVISMDSAIQFEGFPSRSDDVVMTE